MPTLPRVSVLVLNYNGRNHLEACLPTLEAQVYPKDRCSIEVIDNGSTDGSVALVRERFPGVRVHEMGSNLGFAAAYDRVIRAHDADFVALLNNDTRVQPTWLTELVSAAERHHADCVASRILDWDGQRIDFVAGLVSFIAHAWQRNFGEPADRPAEEWPLLFACGGSMLISRQAYLDAGGLDLDFFAYFEDVDLGWRVTLAGYRTVLAPKAITYHRLHGTYSWIAFAQRLRLYERNALETLYKNYGDESLPRVLPAAVALSLLRGLSQSGIDSAMFAFGSEAPPATVAVTARTVVHLLALEDFGLQLPSLRRKRALIQSQRRAAEPDVLALFGDPFRLHDTGAYEAVARALIRDFEIAPLFEAAGSGRAAAADAPMPTALPAPAPLAMDATPLVSIIVLTALGATHLADCLSSIRAQTYPAACREVIVVDNASPSDPTATAEAYYPGVRVIRNSANLGFAAGNNVGARAARGTYLVFLNDDTRVHPDWLAELVATAARRQAACVGSHIVTWNGAAVDFVGGDINCEGKGFSIDYHQPMAGRHDEERPSLFACGAAVLVHRDLFLETGAWDEGTFAYYEDVELGWRLWLLGHEVWLSPRSIVYHRHHGTSGKWAETARVRNLERNALRILYTHLERDSLQRVLPAALMLAADRALLATGLSRVAEGTQPPAAPDDPLPPPPFKQRLKLALRGRGVTRQRSLAANLRHLGARGLADAAREATRGTAASPAAASVRQQYEIERGVAQVALDGRMEPFPIAAAAALSGIQEFLLGIPQLSERRAWLQARRRRSDREILTQFRAHWIDPCGAPRQREHNHLQRILVETFGIDALLGREDGDQVRATIDSRSGVTS